MPNTHLLPASEVRVGGFAVSKLHVKVPVSINLGKAYAYWELVDTDNRVWNRSDAELEFSPSLTSSKYNTVTAEAQIAIPANLPVAPDTTEYQVRWTVVPQEGAPVYVYSTVRIAPREMAAQGAIDAVELYGDDALLRIRLPTAQEKVVVVLHRGNEPISKPLPAALAGQDYDGFVYEVTVTTAQYGSPSLDPLTAVWKYGANREVASLYVVNPAVLDAVKMLQSWINRACTDMGFDPGTEFSTVDYVTYLRQGRDRFNAAAKPTTISMLNAQGPVRHFWVGYSCVIAARAQQLAEGMKSFDFGSQAVTLNVDRSSHWGALADQLELQLNDQVVPFKDNLYHRGIHSGDGSSLALRKGAVGTIGLTLHGMSPLMHPYGHSFGNVLRR